MDFSIKLAELKKAVLGAVLDDVLLQGIVDPDEMPTRFRALHEFLLLEFGASHLQCQTIESEGSMSLRQSDRLLPKSLVCLCDEDEFQPAVASIAPLILLSFPSGDHNRIAGLHLWIVSEKAGDLCCEAMQLDLANGQEIFIDPTNYFGIRLGGSEQRKMWQENWPGANRADAIHLV